MKTLDEVIDALEVCSQMDAECDKCPYHATAKGWCEEKDRDALQYLKWYKELADDSAAFAQWKENPPLTWDELKTMEGKPVWVEYFGANRWVIPQEFRFDIAGREYLLAQDGGMIFRFQQHDVWEAYRKERV